MSKPWDTLTIGGDILADSYFGGGYESDFTQPLDGGILGTAPGYSGDPFNFTYPTDGQFKMGEELQCHQNFATGYQHPWTSDAVNKQDNHYVHPHNGNPDPLAMYEKRDGKLVLKGRLATEADSAWARIKGYEIDTTGAEATYDFLIANGGIDPTWAPAPASGNQIQYFFNKPAKFITTKISTFNRRSMSFGRSAARVQVPVGARATGTTTDVRNIDTWFPAIWDLEDVPARCDINGRFHTKDTYTPGNFGAGGVKHELDQGEFFGYSDTELHITSHHYTPGQPQFFNNRTGNDGLPITTGERFRTQVNHVGAGRVDLSTPAYPPIGNIRGQWLEIGVDRFPPGGVVYPNGLICYHVNGIVRAMYHMPAYLGQPKKIYEPVATVPYVPRMDLNTGVIILGEQAYDNGQPAYMHWCQVLNIATNAGFTRVQAVPALNAGTAPSFSENEEMVIEWIIMKPLIDENPDSRPYIDYMAGDFGGSSPTPYDDSVDIPILPDTPVEPEPENPDLPVEPVPDTPLALEPVNLSRDKSSKVKVPAAFTEHNWFTLMRGIEPDILIKEKPGFVFSNGRDLRMPVDVQRKTVADEN